MTFGGKMIYLRHAEKILKHTPLTWKAGEPFSAYIKPFFGSPGEGFLFVLGFFSSCLLPPFLSKDRRTCFIILKRRYARYPLHPGSLCYGQCGTDILGKGIITGIPSGSIFLELILIFIYWARSMRTFYSMPRYRVNCV